VPTQGTAADSATTATFDATNVAPEP